MNQSHFLQTHQYLDSAAESLKLSKEILTLIKTPDRELYFEIPVANDRGELEIFHGYRVQHNNSRGPNKGGVSYASSLNLDLVRENAALATWKASVVDIPFGGSYGGVCCDPKLMSKTLLERISRLYLSKVDCIVGPQLDILGRDFNTNTQTMSWMLDEYGKRHGFQPACVVGKPIQLFGTELQEEASATGLISTFIEAMKYFEMDLSDLDMAISGFGNMGSNTAQILYELGHKIIAVSDSSGAIHNTEGINIPELIDFKRVTGSVQNFSGSTNISNEELLALQCDVLILASTREQITKHNVNNIKAPVIVEGANCAIDHEVDEILESKGKRIIPDILAGVGETIVSYFEWVQNLQQFRWSKENISSELVKSIANSFAKVINKFEEHSTHSLRQAAYILSLERLAEVTILRGYQ